MKTLRRLLPLLALLAVLALLAALALRAGLLENVSSPEALRAWIDGFGPAAAVVYFLLQAVSVIIAPIPSNITTAAGALALGFWPGFLIGAAAIFAGSCVVFGLARRLGEPFVRRFADAKTIARYMPLIEKKRDAFLFLALLLPFLPDDVLCILAGLTRIPAARFAVIALITRPWGLLFAAAVGSGGISLPVWGWALIAIGGVALFLLGLRYGDAIEERILKKFR
ncbi:MAG TPA: TVP38/TMEM64 family protein [Candidatus Onthenecus intestinigallinarum]|uniref:TVP38/TMEM64 family membrane protein n=1 Tax=Candidatus Onthenecus intestinigallinarum TaxID=2840875 RepID=A0A9D0ZAT0_9FIRM|nr:TVP38/TMEM64 family protein [Candidatus Onthenecus intestinigallinarum]